jgi:hypothetical protein
MLGDRGISGGQFGACVVNFGGHTMNSNQATRRPVSLFFSFEYKNGAVLV